MDVFYWLWIAYFSFQLASLVISTLLKLWQVFNGKHKRYSRALLAEEIAGAILTGLALLGLWGFIHSINYGQVFDGPAGDLFAGVLGTQLFWRSVFWALAGLLLLQPMLPKSKLIYSKGGASVTLINWFLMVLWIMPMQWALWVYASKLS